MTHDAHTQGVTPPDCHREPHSITHLFLISAAMVMNACSTFVALLAEVSRNGMPISSAKACSRRAQLSGDASAGACTASGHGQTSCYGVPTAHDTACECSCMIAPIRQIVLFSPALRCGSHLGCLVVDDLLGRQITLVAHQQLVDILVRVAVDLVQPLLYVVKALLVCHVVNNLCSERAISVAGYQCNPCVRLSQPTTSLLLRADRGILVS